MAANKGKKKTDKKAEEMDEEGADPVANVASLPTVQEIGWTVTPYPPKVSKKPELKKEVVEFRLRPYTPKSKSVMVTMSDLNMSGSARGAAKPARNKRKD